MLLGFGILLWGGGVSPAVPSEIRHRFLLTVARFMNLEPWTGLQSSEVVSVAGSLSMRRRYTLEA